MNKNLQLPEVIKNFYHAVDNYDDTLLSGCFDENSLLYDENKEFHGPAEISEHIIKANKDVNAVIEVTNYKDEGGIIVVTATLSGEFDGSPVSLDFHFTLGGEKIKFLNITLEGE